jgi:hypothetical protein
LPQRQAFVWAATDIVPGKGCPSFVPFAQKSIRATPAFVFYAKIDSGYVFSMPAVSFVAIVRTKPQDSNSRSQLEGVKRVALIDFCARD